MTPCGKVEKRPAPDVLFPEDRSYRNRLTRCSLPAVPGEAMYLLSIVIRPEKGCLINKTEKIVTNSATMSFRPEWAANGR